MVHELEHGGYAYTLTPSARPSAAPLELRATRRLFDALRGDARRMRELRALLGGQSSGRLVSRMTDDHVVRQLASRVAARRLFVYAEPVRRHAYAFDLPEEQEQVLGPLPVAETQEPADERVDTPAQVAALLHAAREGLPFCEECEKAKRQLAQAAASTPPRDPYADTDVAAQAAAMRQAATNGTPFCEECEKAKKAQASGAATAGS